MKKFVATFLALGVLFTQSDFAAAEAIATCPPYSEPQNLNDNSTPNAISLSFNGQFLQRINPENLEINKNLKGVVGCYKFFSKNTGIDALWDIGSVTFEGNTYYWVNAAGRRWKLIPDFENLLFTTDSSNPYFDTARDFAIASDSVSAITLKGDCKIKNSSGSLGVGFPVPSRKISQEKQPKVLAVMIDFKNPIAGSLSSEFQRFNFDKVETFFFDNSFGNSALEIVEYPEVVYVDGDIAQYEKSQGNNSLLRDAYDALKKKVNLEQYSGYIFATSENGPEFASGYAAMLGGLTQIPGDQSMPFVWMGGKDSKNITWVELWKMLAHEIGHMYGLPDLYMTQGSNFEGNTAGPFDLMDGIAGKANSLNFMHRWMLGWITSEETRCQIPTEEPKVFTLSPVALKESKVKGLIIPITNTEALLVEARVNSKYDSLFTSQEGVVVYHLDSKKPSGSGPLKLIPASNFVTLSQTRMDDVDRFIEGALRPGDLVTYKNISVHLISRTSNNFVVGVAIGDAYPKKLAAEKAAAEKAAAEKAAAEKAAAEKAPAEKAPAEKAPAEKAAATKSIKCVRANKVKSVTGKSPKCPTGYRFKN